MWFHHVSQSPDDRGCTIAINYCKDQTFSLGDLVNYLSEGLMHFILFLQGTICNLTLNMLISTSYNLFITDLL